MSDALRAAVHADQSHRELETELAHKSVREAAQMLFERERARGHVAYEPEDAEYFLLPPYRGLSFSVQCAPWRGKRPMAPRDCPVCRDTLASTSQRYVAIRLGGRIYYLLANPFPLMPMALTVVAEAHRNQEWEPLPEEFDQPRAELPHATEMLAWDAAALAEALNDYVVIWNGRRAGASLPNHAHLQAFQLPVGHGPLAVQQITDRHQGRPGWYGLAGEYPIAFHFAEADAETAARASANAMREWRELQGPAATGNLMAVTHGGALRMWYFPRNIRFPRAPWLSGALGALEVCGSFVLAAEWEFEALREGRISTKTLYAALRAVAPNQASLVASKGA